MAEKPRQVIPGLGNLPQVVPAADPRPLDAYARPGVVEVGRPANTNPMLQLSEALSKLDPTLQRATSMAAQEYGAEEVAKGEKDFWDNREKWNQLIKDGAIPEGVSPYYQRGLQRASLKQLSGEYYAQTYADFYGEAGAEARNSNDPAMVTKFLQASRDKFTKEHLKNGDRDLFSPLDMQEVFNQSAEQTARTMLQTHAAYRVSEREKEYEASASAQIDAQVTRHLGQITKTSSEDDRQRWIAQAAREANDVLYNPDTGIVKNGLLASKGNQLLVDTLTTAMMKTGNRDYGEVLKAIKTEKGAPVGNTQYAQAKLLQAEEHLTDLDMKTQHFKHWQDGLGFEQLSREHTVAGWEKEDARWDREKLSWAKQDGAVAQDEIINSLSRRVFEGLRRPGAQGVKLIDDAIREAEQVSWKDAEHLKNMVHTATKQRADYEDDPMTVATLRKDISMNPLGFGYDRLTSAVEAKLIKPTTMMQMADDLDRNRQNGDHPFMRQPEFTSMLHKVEKSMAQSIGEDEFGEGAIRASEAVGDFRDLAVEWIEKNPQGSPSAFRNYMRAQVTDVAERHNAAFGASQKQNRAQQESKGAFIRDSTSAQQGEKRQKEADQAAAKKQADEQQAKRKQYQDEILRGERTDEGRKILRLPDGSIETEKTVTVTDPRINDGRPTNIPTIYNGKHVTEDDAKDIIAKSKGVDPDTGRRLRGYYSITDAVIAARERSNQLGKKYAGEPKKPVPPDAAIKALEGAPSAANIAAFIKTFGAAALPSHIEPKE